MFKKVYIVDDDEVSIFLAEAIMEAECFAAECKGYLDAQKALNDLLESAHNGNPDALPEIIFLDLNMPFLSGWDFLEALVPVERDLKDRCRIYILTSSVDEQERRRAANTALVAGFLQKPLEDELLLQLKQCS
ncbi:response regulator [Pontibacter mangrovi]|uniref:Response regulator n=1 Tax=Pontibacter mangrovi TaxID=2589816 RepID=A0A501WDB2_9BACT|nr:response regulator [Pontibacter mangrovi]TPE46370.1 response regulator [Pontibacter mangrovi]